MSKSARLRRVGNGRGIAYNPSYAIGSHLPAGDYPLPPLQYTSLAAALAAVPDSRHARGCRYPWALLLLLGAAALLSHQTTVRALADWLRWQAAAIQAALPAPLPRLPSAATLDRPVRHRDIAARAACLHAYSAQFLPAPPPPPGNPPARSAPQVPKGHGRRETRWVACRSDLLDHLEWRGVTVPAYLN